MGLKECQITLDSSVNTYYAGQTVNGTVDLKFDSPKKIRGIKIRFLGEANTSWYLTETKTNAEGKTEDESTEVKGNEEYFQISYYLIGGANSKEIELEAGTHSYPFTCALPPTLPSSFEGEFGHVRYTIKVTLDRPWKFDQDSKMAFTVISPVDLNKVERLRNPYKLELEKTFCCFCCASGPLSVVIALPVTGFVSGQTMPIVAEIDNASNVDVDKVKFIFRKVLAFYTHTPRRETKRDNKTIAELAIGPFNKAENRTVKQALEIPPLPPSNLDNCGIIDLHYELFVEIEVSGLHSNLTGVIPITLGTMPLTNFQSANPSNSVDPSMMPTQPVSPAEVGGAVGWSIANGDNQLYPNIAPPTFTASQFRANTIRDKEDNEFTRLIGDQAYAPRYPTFNFQPSAPTFD